MKIKVSLSVGLGARNGILEVPDEATDEEIDEEVDVWASNYIDLGWCKE